MLSMTCSTKTSLLKSGNFKNEVIVCHTYKRRVDPGDIVDFRIKNQCGSGIRLDLLKSHLTKYDSLDEPSDYFFIVEAFGYECEAMEFATNARYIGTSPGWLNFEFTKSIDYCIQNTTITSSGLNSQINTSPTAAIKLYRRELGNKEFHIPNMLIGPPNTSAKYCVLSFTNKYPVYSQDPFARYPTPNERTNNSGTETFKNSRFPVEPVTSFDQGLEDLDDDLELDEDDSFKEEGDDEIW